VETFKMQGFVRRNVALLRTPVLALFAEKDLLVDNEVTIAALRRASCPRLAMDVFVDASHVLPACVPGSEMVSRCWSWFRQPAPTGREELVLHRVPAFPPESLAGDPLPVLGRCDAP
jgi:hypothetical protein